MATNDAESFDVSEHRSGNLASERARFFVATALGYHLITQSLLLMLLSNFSAVVVFVVVLVFILFPNKTKKFKNIYLEGPVSVAGLRGI